MSIPTASHTNNRIHVTSGRKSIMPNEITMPRIEVTGIQGARNGRANSGRRILRVQTPAHTMMKASSVPILVISPKPARGTVDAKPPPPTPTIKHDIHAVRDLDQDAATPNIGCIGSDSNLVGHNQVPRVHWPCQDCVDNDVEPRADHNRTEFPNRHVAIGVFRFLGSCQNGVEADVSEKDDT